MKAKTTGQRISDNSYEQLFKLSNDLLSLANFEGYFTMVNDKWTEVLGYSREELLGQPFLSFVHPEDLARTKSEAEAISAGKTEIIKFENRYRTKAGDYVWLEWNSVIDANAQLIYSVARDITDVKKREEFNNAVQQTIIEFSDLKSLSETNFDQFIDHYLFRIKQLFEVDIAGYWVFDKDNKALRCLAISQEPGVGMKRGDVIYEKDAPQYFQGILNDKIVVADHAQSHKNTFEFTEDYLKKYGIVSMMDVQLRSKGDLHGVLCLESCKAKHWTQDDQRHALSLVQILANTILYEEKRLVDEKFTTVSDMARIGSWEVDLEAMGVYWSPMTCQIHDVPVGYKVDVANAINFYEEGYSRDRITEVFNLCLEKGESFDEELKIITAKGEENWVRAIGIAIRENNKTVRIYGLFQDVDDQRRSKIELERLSLVASKVHNGVIITDANSVISWVNEAFIEQTGYEFDELIGKKPATVLHGEKTDPKHKQKFIEGVASKQPFSQEILNYNKNGQPYWIEMSVTPIRNEKGEVAQFVGIQTVISERKRAELELTDKKIRLSHLIDSTDVGTWEWDIPTGEVIFNERWPQMLGYTLEELGPTQIDTWKKYVYPEDQENVEAAVEAHFNGEADSYNAEFRMNRKDGGVIWVWARGKVVAWTEDGKPLKMFGAHSDITKQKLTELTLEEKEQFMQRIFDQSLNGIYIYSIELGTNIYMNNRYTELTGYSMNEINDMSDQEFFALFHPDDQEAIDRHMKTLAGDNPDHKVEPVEYRFLKKNGEWMWCLSADVPFEFDEKGFATQFLGTFIDITALKNAEQQIQRMQKLDDLGTVAGGIAHDFNNYLTAIFSNLEILRLSLPEDSKVLSYIFEMSKALKTAKQLTGQLLTFSKGGAPALQPVALNDFLKDAVLFNLHGSNVKVEFDIQEGIWPVYVDRGQINQVLSNLTINAKQAMPDGGLLKVSAKNSPGSIKKTGQENDLVCISISDEGKGIPAEILGKVFDPYFTTKAEGHGLGLSVVHSIITRHNGEVKVTSKERVGTEFKICLPKSNTNGLATEKEDIEDKSLAEGLNILLMDDNAMILKAGSNMLTMMGHAVETAVSGDDALKLYQENQTFDLAILDLTIPGGRGGKEIVGEILAINPKHKVIASSGYASNEVMANYEDYGFVGVLAKPYTYDEILEEIDRVRKL